MKFHSQLITLQGEPCLLLLALPDFRQGVQVEYYLPTLLEEKRTGIESRPQESRAPVLTQRYALWLKGDDAQRFRALLGQMAGMRVAVPLWNDLHEASAWGSRIHASR